MTNSVATGWPTAGPILHTCLFPICTSGIWKSKSIPHAPGTIPYIRPLVPKTGAPHRIVSPLTAAPLDVHSCEGFATSEIATHVPFCYPVVPYISFIAFILLNLFHVRSAQQTCAPRSCTQVIDSCAYRTYVQCLHPIWYSGIGKIRAKSVEIFRRIPPRSVQSIDGIDWVR